MGPMGLARSAGQTLYDLAIRDIDGLVGSRERLGSLIFSKFLKEDKPTTFFFDCYKNLHPHSMVQDNEVSFTASLARIAVVVMIADGTLHAVKEDNDKI